MAEKKSMSLFMKIMIGLIPILLCGLVCMFIFMKKDKGQTTQEQKIFMADSKEETAPLTKAEAYKKEKEKQDEKMRVAQESQIMSNNAFYDVEDGNKPSQQQKVVQAPQAVAPAPVVERSAPQSPARVAPTPRQVQYVSTSHGGGGSTPQPRKVVKKVVVEDENMSDIDRLLQQQRAAGIKSSIKDQQKLEPQQAQVQQESVQKVKINTNPNGRSRNLNTGGTAVSNNLISAVIHNDQVITSGSNVKLRLSESIVVDGVTVPRNSFITGVATFSKTRMNIVLQSIIVGNNIIPFNKSVYDKDGMQGIYLPDNMKSEAASEAGSDMANGSLNTLTGSMGIIGAALNSGKNLVRKTTQRQTVTLKANYKLFIK